LDDHRDNTLKTEDHRRKTLILVVGSIAVIVLFAIAASSLIKGEPRIAIIDSTAAVLITTLLLFFRFSPYEKECCYVGVALMYGLYAYLFFSGAAKGMTYMWHYTFPFFATFLLGACHGFIATLLLFIPVFIYVIVDALTPGLGYYNGAFAIRFIPSVSVALVFSFLFERERQRFKQQTLKAYREQERIIEERTRQLKKEVEDREHIAQQLRQSQKMEALGAMAGGVAHDLNNILAGIVSYPELIRLTLPDDSSLQKPLKTIENAGKRAAAVVTDMLTIARNVASVKEVVDLNELIVNFLHLPEWQRIVEMYPKVKVVQSFESQLMFISCSQVHIRKCLMNLLYNGVEASAPAGQVIISTGVAKKEKIPAKQDLVDTQQVYFAVQDSGPGIGEEHLAHIFEPFYTTKKMGRSGSGLGLSVVWSTVQEHDGEIRTEDSPHGACFTILFPALPGAVPKTEKPISLPIESLKGKGSLLLVDDEPQLREIGSKIVEMLGYSVSLAQSGEEAIKIFAEGDFDVVILDMLLGDGMNGRQTYEQMLNIKAGQKAIIVSGYSASVDVDKALELGAHAIIKKPYSIEEIGLAVKKCLFHSNSSIKYRLP
jgi:signal transduction histidine kinase/CheY-like chemotaxis protein